MLEIEKPSAGIIGDAYRNTLWSIAKGVLWLLDGFFDILNKLWQYKFFDNDYVNKIFGGAIIVAGAWLSLKIMIELIMNHIVKNDGRDSPLTIFRGAVLAIVMMFLISPLFTFGYQVSNSLNDAVITASSLNKKGSENESTISTAIISAMSYDDQMEKDDKDYFVKHWKTEDITKKEGGIAGIGDVYKYSFNLFMLVVISILTVFLLFFIAIQISKRIMEIALFKIIGPFCCTSLTNNNPQAFQTWCKSTMGLFLITTVQFVSLGLMLNMFGSAIKDNGTMAGLFLIVGALLFIISTPTLISTLLNQHSGLMTAFGDIQSMLAMGHGVNSALKIAGNGLSSTANVVTNTISSAKNKMSGKSGGIDMDALDDLRNTINRGNGFKADQMSREYSKSKGKKSDFGFSNSNPYMNPYSMKFNPIRNQYMNQSGFNNNSSDRRWY